MELNEEFEKLINELIKEYTEFGLSDRFLDKFEEAKAYSEAIKEVEEDEDGD